MSRRRELAVQHTAIGKRLFDKGQYLQSARALAQAYIFLPQLDSLIELARAFRKAELEPEALALYTRLQKEQLSIAHQADVEEELKTLMAKVEDLEIETAQMLRTRLNLARRSFLQGQFDVAAQEYAMVYAINPLPRLLFNIAQSHRRAAQHDQAFILYSQFLDEEDAQSPLRKETLGYLNELRAVAFRPPLHKRAWFWGVLGTVAVGVVAATTAVLTVQPWVRRVSFE